MNKPCVNMEYESVVLNYTSDGRGVCRINSYPVFVPFSIIDEKIKLRITKDKKSYLEGEILEIIESSDERVNPNCESFGVCGGCDLLHMNYDSQVDFKRGTVKNAIKKISKIENVKVNEIIKMDKFVNYRNKAVFNFSIKDDTIKIGFYRKKSNELVELNECKIISNKINEIKSLVQSFCNQYKYMPKNLVVKHSFSTDEIMICLCVLEKKFNYSEQFIKKLSACNNIKSIIINYVDENSILFGQRSETIYGQDYITEIINDIKFKNYLKSFFQVNPVQTNELYNKAISLLDLNKDDILIDIYCGVGTISLISANKVKNVIGIEIVKDAIASARENAIANSIDNSKFILGDAKNLLQYVDKQNNLKIVVDPPRKGLDKKVIDSILSLNPTCIIYISCDEATMARDLKIFNNNEYIVNTVTPLDMFCGTYHVENIVKLEKNR